MAFRKTPEQRIAEAGEQVLARLDDLGAMSWDRVACIAEEMKSIVLTDAQARAYADELLSIVRANTSVYARMGFDSGHEDLPPLPSGMMGFPAEGAVRHGAAAAKPIGAGARETIPAPSNGSPETSSLQTSPAPAPGMAMPGPAGEASDPLASDARRRPESPDRSRAHEAVEAFGAAVARAQVSTASRPPLIPDFEDSPFFSASLDDEMDENEARFRRAFMDAAAGKVRSGTTTGSSVPPDAPKPPRRQDVDAAIAFLYDEPDAGFAPAEAHADIASAAEDPDASAFVCRIPTVPGLHPEDPAVEISRPGGTGLDEGKKKRKGKKGKKKGLDMDAREDRNEQASVPSDDAAAGDAASRRPAADVARFTNLYVSRDGSLSLYEDAHGHLTAVKSDRLV